VLLCFPPISLYVLFPSPPYYYNYYYYSFFFFFFFLIIGSLITAWPLVLVW